MSFTASVQGMAKFRDLVLTLAALLAIVWLGWELADKYVALQAAHTVSMQACEALKDIPPLSPHASSLDRTLDQTLRARSC